MSSNTDVADIIDEALEILETEGWCTRELVDLSGRHCAVGAVLRAFGGDDRLCFSATIRKDETVEQALAALVEAIGFEPRTPIWNWEAVARWNNTKRNERPVLEAFRIASKNLRNEAVPA